MNHTVPAIIAPWRFELCTRKSTQYFRVFVPLPMMYVGVKIGYDGTGPMAGDAESSTPLAG
jgi:hypothetical protein